MNSKESGKNWLGWLIAIVVVALLVSVQILEWKEQKRRSEERQKLLAKLEEKCKAVERQAEENLRLVEKLYFETKRRSR